MIKKTFKTNKFLLIIIIAVSFGMVSRAHALSFGDEFFLGVINDGVPSSESFEAGYINNLRTLSAGDGSELIGTEYYDRSDSTLAGPFPFASDTGAVKQDNGNATFDALGFQYILAKYGAPNNGAEEEATTKGSLVWYLADGFLGDITLPGTFDGHALSHTTGFNPSGGLPVPEPATILLLGVGLSGILVVPRKKLKKK